MDLPACACGNYARWKAKTCLKCYTLHRRKRDRELLRRKRLNPEYLALERERVRARKREMGAGIVIDCIICGVQFVRKSSAITCSLRCSKIRRQFTRVAHRQLPETKRRQQEWKNKRYRADPIYREMRRASSRKRQRIRTPEQKERYRMWARQRRRRPDVAAKHREANRQRISALTPEQREARLARRRELDTARRNDPQRRAQFAAASIKYRQSRRYSDDPQAKARKALTAKQLREKRRLAYLTLQNLGIEIELT